MRSSMIRCGAGIVTANNVLVDTSSFVNILSPADDDAQKVFQSIDNLNTDLYNELSGYPRGVEDIDDSDLSWDNSTLTLTQSVSGTSASFSVLEVGTGSVHRHTFLSDQSASISIPSPGAWWFYYDSGTLQASKILPYGFKTTVVALVYLDSDNNAIAVLDERHGISMPWMTHEYLHLTIGTRFENGLGISRVSAGTGSANGDAEVIVTGGSIWDEDINVDIVRSGSPAGRFEQELGELGVTSGKIPVYYRLGSSADNWRSFTATDAPIHQIAAGQRPAYNSESGGNWSVVEIPTNNRYAVYYICATSNIGNVDGLGYLCEPVFAIMSQGDYSLSEAREVSFADLLLGSLFTNEIKPLYKVVYRCSNGYANTYNAYIFEIDDLRNVAPLPGGNYIAQDHQSLIGRTVEGAHPASAVSVDSDGFVKNLTPVDDTIQKALVTIDGLELDTKDWKLMSGWTYNALTEPPVIDIVEEVRVNIDVGIPIRFLDPTGINVATVGTGEISGFSTLTGLIGAVLESSGRLYIEIVDEGAGNYRLDFYAHANMSTGVLRTLVGHSATYSVTGSVSVFEDNGSGLSGSITVNTLGAGLALVEFYRWGMVTSVSESFIGFAGQAITSNVSHMWYGRPTKVTKIKDLVSGTVGTSAHLLQSNNSQYLYYSKAPGRVVRQNFIPFAVNNAGVNITYQVDQPGGYSGGLSDIFTSRLSLGAVSLVHSVQEADIATGLNRLVYGDRLEVASESIPSGELMGTVENVSCNLVIVLE